MKRYLRALTLLLLLLIGVTGAVAQQIIRHGEQKSLMGIEVHFRFDKSDLDLSYMGNEQSLARFAHVIDSIGLFKVDSIVVVSQSSPEGPYSHNMRLSQRRAATMRRTIERRHPELKELLRIHPDGESWLQLRELVASDTIMSQQTIAEVLAVIDSDVNIATKKRRMQQLDAYSYLYKTYYPRIRNSVFCIVYYNLHTTVVPIDKLLYHAIAPTPVPKDTMLPTFPIQPMEHVEHKPILALKTNLLYDVPSLLNYSVEFPVGKRFSVLWYHQFPWWTWGEASNEYCIRFLSIGGEARWWFKPEPRIQMGNRMQRDKLVGHFLGVYAESGKWDFEWQRAFCHQGEHWSVGLSYGYAMPIGRRLNLELSLSLGYASIPFRKFEPSEDYEILWRDPVRHGRWHYFGPTKAQVSLVYPIIFTTKR